MSKQLFLDNFLNLQKQLEENDELKKLEWKLEPENIYELYQHKAIDQEYAVYILKTLFYELEPGWQSWKKMNKFIEYILKISKSDKDLEEFLENVVISEWHYFVRFEGLRGLANLFPKKAKKVFQYCPYGMISYIIAKKGSDALKPLIPIIDSKLLKIFIFLKRELGYRFYYHSDKDKIRESRGQGVFEYIFQTKKKKSQLLKEFSTKNILNQKLRSYAYARSGGYMTNYISYWRELTPNDSEWEKRNPNYILYEMDNIHFGIKQTLLESIINGFKELFNVKEEDLKWSLIKTMTTYIYLTLEVEELQIFMRYKLDVYAIKKEEN